MRLDFNVLWVDDQPQSVKAQIEAIQKQMEAEGFNFNATLFGSVNDVRPRLSDDVFTDEIDLVLVDWDLGGGIHGQDAIKEIRDTVRYKDVVFYSGQTAPDQLRKDAFEAGLEGIYCSNREGLIDEVVGVFESLVKKVLDLDHTRGIVMGATCDIDHIVKECLAIVHDKSDGDGKSALMKDALQRVEEKVAKVSEGAKKLQGATTLADFFNEHMIFTSVDGLRMLSKALKADTLKVGDGARKALNTYIQEVVPHRAGYAHLVLVPDGKPTTIANDEGKTISLEDARKLRKLILGLRYDFRDLLNALKAIT